MIHEIKGVASFNAQEVAVDSALIPVIATHDLHACLGGAYSQSGLTAIAAVGARSGNVLHLPGTGFIAVSAGGQRAHRADIDAHAALFALQMVFAIRSDYRVRTTVLHAQR